MHTNSDNVPREALSIAEACATAGIGRTKIYEAIANGSLQARKCGKRTLVLRADLRAYLAALPSAI
jgi:excisionase family DNA binding protein